MGLDIFFKEDIANALAAAEEAASSVASYSDDERARAFLAGWRSALRTVATAFGLSATQAGLSPLRARALKGEASRPESARMIAALPRLPACAEGRQGQTGSRREGLP